MKNKEQYIKKMAMQFATLESRLQTTDEQIKQKVQDEMMTLCASMSLEDLCAIDDYILSHHLVVK